MFTARYGRRPVLIVFAAAVALAGCSSDEGGVGPAATGSAATWTGYPSASASAQASAPAGGLPRTAGAKVTGARLGAVLGAAAVREGTVSTSIAVTGPLRISGRGRTGGAADRSVTVSIEGEKDVSVVRAAGAVYLKLPGGQLLPGKDWVGVPQDDQDDPVATMYTSTFAGYEVPSDLAATSTALAALGTYRVSGPEPVGGTAATKFTVATTARKASALLPPAYQAVNPDRVARGDATVSVWVDARGRLLRTATTATIPRTRAVKVLIGYSGWGGAVAVQAPPASSVGKLSQ